MGISRKNQNAEEGIDRFLGKTSPRVDTYDAELLVAIPRAANRDSIGIKKESEIFGGVDIWTAYEVSFLLNSGMPVVGVIQFSVPAHSTAIVESKSVKLYLSSYNGERMGGDVETAIAKFCERVEADISRKTDAKVSVRWVTEWEDPRLSDAFSTLESKDFEGVDWGNAASHGLQLVSSEVQTTIRWHSALLRSQCRITQQPDWGDIYIELVGDRFPSEQSMLAHIMNMRDEEHFHEEIVEAIYFELLNLCEPEDLLVYAQYTRRGGVDINPLRCLRREPYASWFSGPFPLFKPTFRQ